MGAPLCKQPFPALSTAEAELIEVIEAVVVCDSIARLVDEMVRCSKVPQVRQHRSSLYSDLRNGGLAHQMKVRAAHLKWSGQWGLKYQPGRELIADIGTKALPVARVHDLRQTMGMSWQPDSVGEVHEEDKGIVAPRAMKLVAKYHLEKAMRIVVVLSALQEVHAAMAENVTKDAEENAEGDQVLYLLSVMMMFLQMVLMKILQRCRSRWNPGSDEDSIRVRSMRSQSAGTSSMSRPTALELREVSHFILVENEGTGRASNLDRAEAYGIGA